VYPSIERGAAWISELAHAGAAFAACFGAGLSSRVGRAVARGCQEGTLKLWNSIMSGLLLAPLAGCPGGDDTGEEGAGSTTSDDDTTTTSDDTTGGSTGDSTAAVDSSSGAPVEGDCQEERPVPDPPVDCSGATMVLQGSVILEEGSNDDISMLEGVREVTGAIRVNRQDFTNLDFLACVDTVGADLTIFGNEQLTNVEGLYSLTSVTDFVFSQNDAVEDFNALPLIQQIDGGLVIRENASLRTISGFHSFVGLNGLGLNEDGEVIGGNLTIQQNPVLEDMDGLGGIRVVNGRVQITNNPMLCISSVICVITGIVQPAVPPDTWTTANNNGGC
jgi:hypothetical protein